MTVTILPQTLSVAASADNRSLAVDDLIDQAKVYVEGAQAENTRRSHAAGIRSFAAFCAAHGLRALPADPQTVALYATHLAASKRLSTIRVRLAAISVWHQRAGFESPCSHRLVREIVHGVAREKGSAATRKSALTLDHLRAMLLAIGPDDLKAKRDHAIVLLGFAAALRRSEIAALRVEDLRFEKRGLVVTIRRSKTDQEAKGVEIAVPYVPNRSLCAVHAVKTWLEASGVVIGPLFRTFSLQRQMLDKPIDGRDVANLVKKLTSKARLDGDFSGHSLRAGFATSAAAAKASLDSIARTTRHKSLSVLMGYVRPAQAFDDVALSTMIA
jgi:integrase